MANASTPNIHCTVDDVGQVVMIGPEGFIPQRTNFFMSAQLQAAARRVWVNVFGITPYDVYLCRVVKIPTEEEYPSWSQSRSRLDRPQREVQFGYYTDCRAMSEEVTVVVHVRSKRHDSYLCRS